MAAGCDSWDAALLYRQLQRSQRAHARSTEASKRMLTKGVVDIQALAVKLSEQFEAEWDAKLGAQAISLKRLHKASLDPHGVVQTSVRNATVQQIYYIVLRPLLFRRLPPH
jgi:hypothetical protein